MENSNEKNKKKRGKRKRRRPPPPPIFNRDRPAPNDPMPGVSLFPGNSVAPTNIFLNQNEIMNKFNELLDWSLPAGPQTTHVDFDDRRAYGITDCDDRRAYGVDDYVGRRAYKPITDYDDRRAYGIADYDDRRAHRDMDYDDRRAYRNADLDGRRAYGDADYDDRRAYRDADLDGRRAYGDGDYDDRRAYGYVDLDDRRAYGHATPNSVREKSPFQNPFFNQGEQRQLDSFDLRNRLGHPNKRMKSIQDPDDILRKDSCDRFRRDIVADLYGKKESWSKEMTVLSETCAPNSKRRRLTSCYSDEQRVDDPRFYPSDDLPPDFNRQVKEYWPDREQSHEERPFYPSLGLRIDYPNERSFRGNRNEVYDEKTDDDFREEDYVQSDNPSREAGDRLDIQQKGWYRYQYSNPGCDQDLRDSAPRKNSNEEQLLASSSYNRFSDQDLRTSMPTKNHSNKEQMLAGSSYDRFSVQDLHNPASLSRNNNTNKEHVSADSSHNRFRDGKNVQNKFEGTQSMNQENDLIVVIHKQNFAKFSPKEAHILRSMLIDLVVNCGNPNEMPEFVSSGLMRGGRVFYLNCRTMETMRWLLQQSLPPLNGFNLYVRKDKVFQVANISAFAQRCTRTKEEIIKLLKLQNGKKGFNFDNWTMKNYNSTPTGIHIAFEVPLEDAQLLKDLGSQLSFELKSLKFSIEMDGARSVSSLPW